MPKAYSYLRFSTPEQAKGDSKRRQLDRTRTYAREQGLTLDESLTYHDLGVSAFRGKNVEAGALGKFLEAVKAGVIEQGSYLLVESLDRLSRKTPRKAARVLEDICDAGITVVTLTDSRVYTSKTLDDDLTAFIYAVIVAGRAYDESSTKADRLRRAWANKRANAKQRPMTAQGPAWLELDRKRGKFVPVKGRAAIVKRIFRETLKGRGQHTIAEALNSEGVPVFGRGQFWHRSYVDKILRNPAVVGLLVSCSEHEDENGKRVRKEETRFENYYPAVIDPDTWQRVQALLPAKGEQGARSPLRGRHAGGTVHNLFGGLCRCSLCDSTVTLVNKGTPPKGGRYLVCTRAKAGAGCPYRALRYDGIETLFLLDGPTMLRHVPAGARGADIDRQIEAQEQRLQVLIEGIENLVTALERGHSPTLAARVRETEAEIAETHNTLGALYDRRKTSAGPLVAKRAAELADLLARPTLDRTATNALMRQVFSRIVLDRKRGSMTFEWHHGGESELVVMWPDERA